MRNIVEYPITKEEIVAELKRLKQEDIDKAGLYFECGGILGPCLDEAIKCVEEHYAPKNYLEPFVFELNDGEFTRQGFIDMMEITGKFDLDEA
jgi:hypothetical protein